MTEWNYIVVALCFLLLFFLIAKEASRKNRKALLMRLLATTLAVASLAPLAFPLYYCTNKNAAASQEAIIITDGFNADSVTNFLSLNGNAMPVIFCSRSIKNIGKYNAHYVADIRLLSQQYNNISTFHVFGFGFDDYDLNALSKRNFVFHPSHLSSGITSIKWQQKVKEGERFMIQGTYHNSRSSNTKIIISHFTTTLDSALVSADTNAAFTLTAIPKWEGRTTLSLAVITNNDTIEKETVPVQVERGERLKILMLASSPDFDNKFLQNSLSKTGYEVAARTTISKNKYAYNYLNTPAVSLSNITLSLLDKFDVLIADAAELSVLPPSQLSLIQSQVAQKSMGLVIKADSLGKSAFYATHFPLNAVAGDTQQQLKTFLLDTSGKLPQLLVDYPLSIKNETGTQPLVLDKQNKVYASRTLYGSGKMILTTLSNTYTWALSGNEEAYNRFWSALLTKAAAQPASTEAWSVSPQLPAINTRVQLRLQTNSIGLPKGLMNGTPVYLKRNADLPYEWSGIYYPVKEGWQTGIGLSGNPYYWYAYRQTDWQNVYASQKIIATQQYISSHLYRTKKASANRVVKQTEFPKPYLFILFIFCCGFLWAENKGLFSFNTKS